MNPKGIIRTHKDVPGTQTELKKDVKRTHRT
jgi:hypothetical protein